MLNDRFVGGRGRQIEQLWNRQHATKSRRSILSLECPIGILAVVLRERMGNSDTIQEGAADVLFCPEKR